MRKTEVYLKDDAIRTLTVARAESATALRDVRTAAGTISNPAIFRRNGTFLVAEAARVCATRERWHWNLSLDAAKRRVVAYRQRMAREGFHLVGTYEGH